MCVDCVLASPRIAQVDPGDEPLPEVVLSQPPSQDITKQPLQEPTWASFTSLPWRPRDQREGAWKTPE
jgi:hypothetical protein